MKYIFIFLLFVSTTSWAQTFERMGDINPGSVGSNPKILFELNGKLLFSADDSVHGNELWSTDGTAAGTVLIKDINNAFGSWNGSDVNYGKVYNGKYYFRANDLTHGPELWVTDGTTNGTLLLKDINPNGAGCGLVFVEHGGKLYFNGYDDVHGSEIWVTDGTAVGTLMVKDINPGSADGGFSEGISYLGKLYFTASDGVHGFKVWTSDGTSAGTLMLKDTNPGNDAWPEHYTVCNGKLLFTAYDDLHDYEVWVSDGTTAGTQMIKDINPLTGLVGPNMLKCYNGKIYFGADDSTHGKELWVTDGTATGTIMLKDINASGSSAPGFFTEYNGLLYFGANDSIHDAELWVTDGTSVGTYMLKELNPIASSSPINFVEYNGKLYFSADMGTPHHISRGLWVTDGTPLGTQQLSPLDSSIYIPGNFMRSSVGALFFRANLDSTGYELWKYTDGPSITNNVNSTLQFEIYPNPTNQFLHIRTDEKVIQLSVHDVLGRQLFVNAGITKRIDVSVLHAGTYTIQVLTPEGKGIQRFVKID